MPVIRICEFQRDRSKRMIKNENTHMENTTHIIIDMYVHIYIYIYNILCHRQPNIYIMALSAYRWCSSAKSCSPRTVLLYSHGLLNVPSVACDWDCMRLHGDSFVGLAKKKIYIISYIISYT